MHLASMAMVRWRRLLGRIACLLTKHSKYRRNTSTRPFSPSKQNLGLTYRRDYYLLQGVAADTSTASGPMGFRVLQACCDTFWSSFYPTHNE